MFKDYLDITNISKYIETLAHPEPTYIDGLQKFKDVEGSYLNIRDGIRVTTGNPTKYIASIYLVGDVFFVLGLDVVTMKL